MSVWFHASVQPREDWCCAVLEGCGAVLPHGILLIDLKQQINNCRYRKGKWWGRTTGHVTFGWDQNHELLRLLQHIAAWPGLQAVFKAELHFPWVYNHVQKKKNSFPWSPLCPFRPGQRELSSSTQPLPPHWGRHVGFRSGLPSPVSPNHICHCCLNP